MVSIPPRFNPDRPQDRAYDHRTFHKDADPGELASDASVNRRAETTSDSVGDLHECEEWDRTKSDKHGSLPIAPTSFV
jgi:hypothetical protein